MKVSELTGGLLDVWVAKALGRKVADHPSEPGWWKVWNQRRGGWDTIMHVQPDEVDATVWSPSTKWQHGGPIIEQKRISVRYIEGLGVAASIESLGAPFTQQRGSGWWPGDTPLEAAMRACVASQFGEQLPAA
jgi:hypothetical protein